MLQKAIVTILILIGTLSLLAQERSNTLSEGEKMKDGNCCGMAKLQKDGEVPN